MLQIELGPAKVLAFMKNSFHDVSHSSLDNYLYKLNDSTLRCFKPILLKICSFPLEKLFKNFLEVSLYSLLKHHNDLLDQFWSKPIFLIIRRCLTLLHSEQSKLNIVLAVLDLSAIGLTLTAAKM